MDLVRGLKERYPQVHIKAFTMVEVSFLAKRGKMSIEEALMRMKEAGVDSCARAAARGGCSRTACGTSSATTRSTRRRVAGDGADWRTGWERLKSECDDAVQGIVEETTRTAWTICCGCARCRTRTRAASRRFIPLAFHPDNTALAHIPKTTGMMDLKQIAIGRLLLDNFPHVKSYWQMVSPEMAQISLRFGADDIDGTVIEEKIYHDAGATTPQGMRRADLMRLIIEAGRVPFERDTMYRAVTRSEDSFTVAV